MDGETGKGQNEKLMDPRPDFRSILQGKAGDGSGFCRR